MWLAIATAISMQASCGPGSGASQGTAPSASGLKVTTSTTFYPTFDPSISDYACTLPSGGPVQVSVNAPAGTQVSVDGQPSRTLAFSTPVSISAGQSFTMVVNTAGTSKTYYVRGLPSDFPAWTTVRSGTPQAEYYAFTPDLPLTNNETPGHYLIIADGNGVPVWWYRSSGNPSNPLILANGDIAFTVAAGVEEHQFNGTLVRKFTTVGLSGAALDMHELQQLSNGDYLIIADVNRGPYNLTAEGGLSSASVIDNVIEEISPNNSLVWSWSALDHLPVSETDPLFRYIAYYQQNIADPYHMNSVEADGDGFVVSFRHLSAIYRIDKASGNIVWKLGGTSRAESLAFVGDAYGNFGGQHDARILSDGTLTTHDNGTYRSRGPRAVRYSINTTARTATALEQVMDPTISSSLGTGSARKLPGGNWGITWGFNPVITEMTPAGASVFRMTYKDPVFSYRALPVLQGTLNVTALRAAMDAQFPR